MQKVYAVYDAKGECYGSLICCPTKGIALRVFADAAVNPQGPIAQYPQDFRLCELGSYDPASGKLEGYAQPLFVADAVTVVAQVNAKPEPVAEEAKS